MLVIVVFDRGLQMGDRYQVQNPTGMNGILYVSWQHVYAPAWTLTIWKSPGELFAKRVGEKLTKLVPDYDEIANDNKQWHDHVHRWAPVEFDRQTHYMEHIHIASDSLVQALPNFLRKLGNLGYLPANEVQPIADWAAEIVRTDQASSSEEG
jgi:hypothetical protein